MRSFLVSTLPLTLGLVVGLPYSALRSQDKTPPNGQEPSSPKRAAFTVPPDLSLTHEEYIQMGLPSSDRIWTGKDMAQAASALKRIGDKNPAQLPRYGSNKSGDVFARITSAENHDFYRNKSLPLQTRFNDCLTFYTSSNQILMTYLQGFLKRAVGDSDLIDLVGLELRSTVLIFELTEGIHATLDKSDPTYKNRLQGFKQMKKGLGSIVGGTFQTLTERDSYRATELQKLAKFMQETFPTLFPYLTADTRMEMLKKLDDLIEDPAIKDLQPDLRVLQSRIKKHKGKSNLP